MQTIDVIFLVDDNPTTLFYNKDVISEFYPNTEIISYNQSDLFIKDFLEFHHEKYQSILLFLDINMPEYNGFELLEEIEEEAENLDKLKIIMLTSSKLKSDFEKSTRFNQIIGYIEKPLSLEKFEKISQEDAEKK